ncbi:undecaprenyldiphospho-muramoylpentapeptide beta-N-acetylglucosaminyltransferase [Thalassoglobus polymorphus]|uniref:UDP-N-acetylglucosamine--N-acetylmuramyl-(pentapeptide) pyrophosphoryl-undecaprenol N-acetylglucosamine transferase n=1 Tax=Thalassoglobus polymorphus TaxID=2527994 RepID=A0A517QN51_9PLAN|nr:undecaprenyldiphospho-muramoylpentapeptide beta-N-acetylglucosaminyltransferase [Thalassoglobus polymorphus]QDT33014.1 UDP-N-acetylglucosamine--N-acetylmuramyl-(pentapeptide) pyrophosphoryl-undecaprenol N-acetylglucosamine transferase MurG [Thalassoglobus polymorphus]
MNTNSLPIQPPEFSFLFCGGGSGGHLFPALAVCEELIERFGLGCRFLFTTTGKQIETSLLVNQNIEIETVHIPSSPLGKLKRHPIRESRVLLSAFRQARKVIKEFAPTIVIGLGGYGSLPGILAARSLRRPILLMEQNTIPGSANVLLSRFSSRICTSYPETAQHFHFSSKRACVETGNPVRKSILTLSECRSSTASRTLTVLGGSQGAVAINAAMQSLVEQSPELFKGWTIFHQTGSTENENIERAYNAAAISAVVSQFFTNIEEVLNQSTFVVSRAGATTLAELAVLGKPALLVPYPNSARDHQEKNALYYSTNKAAVIVHQSNNAETFATHLRNELSNIIASSELQDSMSQNMRKLGKPDAAKSVVQQIADQIQFRQT